MQFVGLRKFISARARGGIVGSGDCPSTTDADTSDAKSSNPDRAELILQGIDVDRSVGLEIGPLDKPLVKRTPNRSIFYADYASRTVLQEKSKGDRSVDIAAIPEIDYLIAPLPQKLGRSFDYIV